MLVLLGSAQHLTYAHPKLLGQCYDNVYHQGRLIGNLPARGNQAMEAQTKKIYDQEYEELIARIENTLDLSLQSTAYPMVLTSLLNLDIMLPQKTFREWQELPEAPPGHLPAPWDYVFDCTQGLVDLSWAQRVPLIQQDDIDKNPLYNEYLYQEADDYDDEEEDMEVDNGMLGNAGDACAAAPTATRHPYCCPLVSYATYTEPSGSPRSVHTDTDATMEFDTLKVIPQDAPPQGLARDLSAPDLVNCFTQGMANTVEEILDKFAQLPAVSAAADATLQERFQQRRATALQPPVTKSAQPVAFPPLTGWNTVNSLHKRKTHLQPIQRSCPGR